MGLSIDLHSNVSVTSGLNNIAISSDTTTDGPIIDTAGFECLEFAIQPGAITDGKYVASILQGDVATLTDAAAVPAAELRGTAPEWFANSPNTAKRFGTVGKKRYQRLRITSTGTTAGLAAIAAVAVLGNPHHGPVADSTNSSSSSSSSSSSESSSSSSSSEKSTLYYLKGMCA